MTAGKERHGLHERLVERLGEQVGDALYTFVACLLALGVSGLAALTFKRPLHFPSLGPTAFIFFESPTAPPASPRNTLIGHAILAGALSLAAFGLLHKPSTLVEDATPARIGAGALSLALTGAVLLLLRSSHPPTGAAISEGVCKKPRLTTRVVAPMAGVALLTFVGWLINRSSGVPIPVWGAIP